MQDHYYLHGGLHGGRYTVCWMLSFRFLHVHDLWKCNEPNDGTCF